MTPHPWTNTRKRKGALIIFSSCVLHLVCYYIHELLVVEERRFSRVKVPPTNQLKVTNDTAIEINVLLFQNSSSEIEIYIHYTRLSRINKDPSITAAGNIGQNGWPINKQNFYEARKESHKACSWHAEDVSLSSIFRKSGKIETHTKNYTQFDFHFERHSWRSKIKSNFWSRSILPKFWAKKPIKKHWLFQFQF